ncbi:MAG: hypothetical protein ACI87W_001693 [Halieaceae bacterium]|jgi:hypothetical protein
MTESKQQPGAAGPSLASRRELLIAGLAGIGASLASAPAFSAQPTLPVVPAPAEHKVAKVRSEFLHFDDPVAKLHAHLRLERTLAEESTTLTWYHWVLFMVPKVKAPIPLLRYEGIEYSLLRHLGNNNFRLQAHNLSYARDLHTGEFTNEVVNPITGEKLEVEPSILTTDPGTVHNPKGFRNVNGDGTYQERYAMFRLEDELLKLDSVRGAPPEMPTTHQENSCAWCPFDEFTNPNIASLSQHFVGTYMYDYPKWIKMGERPGHLMSMFDGKKISSTEELPDEFLDRARREHPELLLPRWQDFDRPLSFKL